jgi:demethylsterigmatocystin 6-O-methyltransferase
VDIGGAIGHQSIALKQKCPELPGRIIVQDQQGVIDQIKEHPLPGFDRVDAQQYNFFTPQPVKGMS